MYSSNFIFVIFELDKFEVPDRVDVLLDFVYLWTRGLISESCAQGVIRLEIVWGFAIIPVIVIKKLRIEVQKIVHVLITLVFCRRVRAKSSLWEWHRTLCRVIGLVRYVDMIRLRLQSLLRRHTRQLLLRKLIGSCQLGLRILICSEVSFELCWLGSCHGSQHRGWSRLLLFEVALDGAECSSTSLHAAKIVFSCSKSRNFRMRFQHMELLRWIVFTQILMISNCLVGFVNDI